MHLIIKYFPDISTGQKEKFEALKEPYHYWNSRINVISRKDIDNLYLHHILHSLGIAKAVKFSPGTEVLDIGTGGGFPGIPLSILFPDVQFTLADSIGKKIRVINEICTILKLTNVEAIQSRAEDINRKFDFVVSRAVTSFPQFVNLAGNKIRNGKINSLPNGILYLKGGELGLELISFPEAVIYDLGDFFEEEYFTSKKLIYLKK